jgi:hypothetical protein
MRRGHIAFLTVVLFLCGFIIARMILAPPTPPQLAPAPEIVRVTEVVYTPSFVSREIVNSALMEAIIEGHSEWVLSFYDEFTGSREITFALLNTALLYDVPVNLLSVQPGSDEHE